MDRELLQNRRKADLINTPTKNCIAIKQECPVNNFQRLAENNKHPHGNKRGVNGMEWSQVFFQKPQ